MIKSCPTCYQISCRQCQWVATDEDVKKIQKGEMTKCPVCGWKPGDAVSATNNE